MNYFIKHLAIAGNFSSFFMKNLYLLYKLDLFWKFNHGNLKIVQEWKLADEALQFNDEAALSFLPL